MKTLRLDLDTLQVSTFEVQFTTVAGGMRTVDSTCLFTQCQNTVE